MDAVSRPAAPRHAVRPLGFKPAMLRGLSERLIASHYENNYGGAVRRLNAIRAELAAGDPAAMPGFRLNGAKREELIAFNSALLHELYFGSLSPAREAMPDDLRAALERDFGSADAWAAEFAAMGKALAGGSGWVLLVRAPDGRLWNQWGADHTHALAGATPILALDMYEHAYHLDFGARAAAYVDAFMENIAWRQVAARWRRPPDAFGDEAGTPPESIRPEDLLARLGEGREIVLDVRRAPTYAASPDVIAGAAWQDPERVGDWAADVPKDRPVVVYCVYGLEVGQDTAAALRARGIPARFLAGGIAAWHAIGGPTAPRT